MRLYTWKDIDRCLRMHKKEWKTSILAMDVYPDELYIYSRESKEAIEEILASILNCTIKNNEIELELGGEHIQIIIEEPEDELISSSDHETIPLFKNILYQEDSAYDSNMITSAGDGRVPVIAFHSYKGGVGRTLSLLSFIKAWTEKRNKDRSLLVIDADIEAPGLSWICDGINREQSFSYLDLMEISQLSRDAKQLAISVKERIKINTFSFESKERVYTQFFMPTYRYEEQLLDIYASPQSVVQGYNKRYFIGEVLSSIGKELGVEAVVIDLRAGMSELSAPLLFDPLIKKYIVSSTSYQSCIGTEMLLRQLLKGMMIDEDTLIPEVLITMVQNNDNTESIHEIIREPYEKNISEDDQDLLDHVIYDLDYASELIRLDSLQSIMSSLEDRRFHEKICSIVESNHLTQKKDTNELIGINDRENVIKRIHELAAEQLTAEGNKHFPMMKTRAIKQLVSIYAVEKPSAVIMGAKGAGKTYLYREILKRESWERFISDIGGESGDEKTIVVPLLATENYSKIVDDLKKGINNYNTLLGNHHVDVMYYQQNRRLAKDMLCTDHSNSEWVHFWKKIMLPEGIDSLDDLNNKLTQEGKRILYLVDGLEELFTNTLKGKNEQVAVSTLCKDVIGELQIKYDSISCLIFARKDMLQNAIPTNFEQFSAQYKGLELLWSKTEALRLALWLVSYVEKAFKMGIDKIEYAADTVIRAKLERLWGKKLGKDSSNEAYSSNWIIAALSDFNGQLQARDIIRFLEYATKESGNSSYDDRYIMPKDIRKAIPLCSIKKIEEIEQEIEDLKPIFRKFRDADDANKKLPFPSGDFNLTKEEESILIREGYLYNDMGRCYLPEIIRHALGFTYSKGARPKVLSLMSRKK